jgi:hypothetical protein
MTEERKYIRDSRAPIPENESTSRTLGSIKIGIQNQNWRYEKSFGRKESKDIEYIGKKCIGNQLLLFQKEH